MSVNCAVAMSEFISKAVCGQANILSGYNFSGDKSWRKEGGFAEVLVVM
jgi:hypothetical protein